MAAFSWKIWYLPEKPAEKVNAKMFIILWLNDLCRFSWDIFVAYPRRVRRMWVKNGEWRWYLFLFSSSVFVFVSFNFAYIFYFCKKKVCAFHRSAHSRAFSPTRNQNKIARHCQVRGVTAQTLPPLLLNTPEHVNAFKCAVCRTNK